MGSFTECTVVSPIAASSPNETQPVVTGGSNMGNSSGTRTIDSTGMNRSNSSSRLGVRVGAAHPSATDEMAESSWPCANCHTIVSCQENKCKACGGRQVKIPPYSLQLRARPSASFAGAGGCNGYPMLIQSMSIDDEDRDQGHHGDQNVDDDEIFDDPTAIDEDELMIRVDFPRHVSSHNTSSLASSVSRPPDPVAVVLLDHSQGNDEEDEDTGISGEDDEVMIWAQSDSDSTIAQQKQLQQGGTATSQALREHNERQRPNDPVAEALLSKKQQQQQQTATTKSAFTSPKLGKSYNDSDDDDDDDNDSLVNSDNGDHVVILMRNDVISTWKKRKDDITINGRVLVQPVVKKTRL